MSVAERTRVCVCGEHFTPRDGRQKYHSPRCATAERVRRHRHPHEVAVCPSCGAFCTRLDEFTGWCHSCTRERLEVAA